jgi:hypothetical protein
MRISGILVFTLTCVALGPPALAATVPQQSQARFEQAVKDGSTSPYYVAIAVIDDRSGVRRAGCWTSNLLEGAITRERGASVSEAKDIALQNRAHVFHFSSPAALDNLPTSAQSDNACAIIATGAAARQQDRGGQIVSAP